MTTDDASTAREGLALSSEGTPHRYLRWRISVGERQGPRRRQWPASQWGSPITQLPRDGEDVFVPDQGSHIGRVMVAARSVGWLRHLLDDPASLLRVRRVTVVVDSWQVPASGWSGRVGPLPHLLSHQIRVPRSGKGKAVIELRLRHPVSLRDAVAAVLPVLSPIRPIPAPASADITAQNVFPAWVGAGPNVTVLTGDLPGNDDIRAHDVLLTTTGVPEPPVEPDLPAETEQSSTAPADLYATVLAADSAGSGAGTRPDTVLVDLERTVVTGRYGPFGPDVSRAELRFGGGSDGRGWRIVGPQGPIWSGRVDRPWLSEDALEALAQLGVVECPTVPARHPMEEAALLVHLAMAGVLLHAPTLPPACRSVLADELADLITAPLPGRAESELEWEVRTVRQRRAALRQHATPFALPKIVSATFPALPALPSVSALLVTKRLEHLPTVIAALEAQTYPNLEIVLCTHGIELPAEYKARLARSHRPIETLAVPAEHGFGEAIGAATAHARGSLVTKIDDDDTYGPEHVWDLVLARHYSGATMVGKGAEFVHLETLDMTVRREAGQVEAFAAVVAGGTMLISRGDLEQVGGWRPVPRSIDRGLIDRVRRAGGLVYRTHPLGYVYHRRSGGHTWDPGLEYFLRGNGMQWSGLPRHSEFGTLAPTGAVLLDALAGSGSVAERAAAEEERPAPVPPGQVQRSAGMTGDSEAPLAQI
ncbi:glycosyltransferase [Polymorphospora sp. NPDC051019]|uniref:glycosyltransferase n=1 Tax=Polymorphospora sp. NPDC051019 TaxID=3155725 RepID=UPI003449EA5D